MNSCLNTSKLGKRHFPVFITYFVREKVNKMSLETSHTTNAWFTSLLCIHNYHFLNTLNTQLLFPSRLTYCYWVCVLYVIIQ